MKILITTDTYSPSINGVVTSVVNLEQELKKKGHDVRILTLKQPKTNTLKEETGGVRYYIPSLSAEKIYPEARVMRSFARAEMKAIIAWRPEIIHSQSEFSTFRMAHKLAKYLHVPLVHTYHTVYEDYTHYFSSNIRIGKRAVQKFSEFILGKTDGIVVPTEKIKQLLLGYGIQKPVFTIPTGIDPHMFQPPPLEEKNQERAKRGISPNDFVLLYLGRLAKEKNVEEVIHFLATTKDSTFMLLIAGDGPNRQELECLVKDYGMEQQVHFLGMILPKDVASIYRLADIFVSASSSETQGVTYIEALASGVPALCRNDACLQDIIIQGQTGFLYETKNEFWDALRMMSTQPEKMATMKQAAQKKAAEYSSERFGQRIEQMYEEVTLNYPYAHKEEKETTFPRLLERKYEKNISK